MAETPVRSAFGYTPASWPDESLFKVGPTDGQWDQYHAMQVRRHIAHSDQFDKMNGAVLKEFGIRAEPEVWSAGHLSVILDFWRKARNPSIQAAIKAGVPWGDRR